MPVKIVSKKPKLKYPRLSIYMGLPKIGKSRAMAKIPKALIVDLENGRGYEGIEVESVIEADSNVDLKGAIDFFFSAENKDYKVLVIDHMRAVSELFAQYVMKKHETQFLGEVLYNKDWYELNSMTKRFMENLTTNLGAHPDKYVFIVAHAMERDGGVKLDVNGKTENMILSAVDAVGYISRDQDGNTTINFGARKGVEFGSRNPRLAGYEGPLDWSRLFELATGNEK